MNRQTSGFWNNFESHTQPTATRAGAPAARATAPHSDGLTRQASYQVDPILGEEDPFDFGTEMQSRAAPPAAQARQNSDLFLMDRQRGPAGGNRFTSSHAAAPPARVGSPPTAAGDGLTRQASYQVDPLLSDEDPFDFGGTEMQARERAAGGRQNSDLFILDRNGQRADDNVLTREDTIDTLLGLGPAPAPRSIIPRETRQPQQGNGGSTAGQGKDGGRDPFWRPQHSAQLVDEVFRTPAQPQRETVQRRQPQGGLEYEEDPAPDPFADLTDPELGADSPRGTTKGTEMQPVLTVPTRPGTIELPPRTTTNKPSSSDAFMVPVQLLIGALVLVAIPTVVILVVCLVGVHYDRQGIMVNRASGAAQREGELVRLRNPGLHFVGPSFYAIESSKTMRFLQWGDTSGRPWISAFAADGNTVEVSLTIGYVLRDEGLRKAFQLAGDQVDGKKYEWIARGVAEAAVKTALTKFTVDEMMVNRTLVRQGLETDVKAELERDAFATFRFALLGPIKPPPSVLWQKESVFQSRIRVILQGYEKLALEVRKETTRQVTAIDTQQALIAHNSSAVGQRLIEAAISRQEKRLAETRGEMQLIVADQFGLSKEVAERGSNETDVTVDWLKEQLSPWHCGTTSNASASNNLYASVGSCASSNVTKCFEDFSDCSGSGKSCAQKAACLLGRIRCLDTVVATSTGCPWFAQFQQARLTAAADGYSNSTLQSSCTSAVCELLVDSSCTGTALPVSACNEDPFADGPSQREISVWRHFLLFNLLMDARQASEGRTVSYLSAMRTTP